MRSSGGYSETSTGSTEPVIDVQGTPTYSVEASRALGRYISLNNGSVSEALPHQGIILKDIYSYLRSGKSEGHIETATSTGKTFLIAKLADAFHRDGLRTLILVPKLPIAAQIAENPAKGLLRFAGNIAPDDIGKHYGGQKASAEDPVVVSTYAGFNNFCKTGELGDFQVVLADEAHLTLGPVTKQNLKEYNPGSVKVGFTATAQYGKDKKVNEIFGNAIHAISLSEAIEMDLVAPVQCLMYATEAEIPYLDAQSEFTVRELERLIDIKFRNQKAIEFAKSFIADGRQGIISCLPGAKMAHPKLLAAELNGSSVEINGETKKIVARSIGSHLSPKENSDILAEFERGEVDVLTFVKSLSEGWDSEVASFLINTCPTTSMVRMKQLIGRVLRKKNGLVSIVVDFIDRSERKRQATAAAALDDEIYEYGKVYASPTGADRAGIKSNLERLIGSELYQNVTSFDGIALSQVNLGVGSLTADELLIRHYNQLLANEGMPEEPQSNYGLPQVALNALAHLRARPGRTDTLAHSRYQKLLSKHEEAVDKKLRGAPWLEAKNIARPNELTFWEQVLAGHEPVEFMAQTELKAVLDSRPEDPTEIWTDRILNGRYIKQLEPRMREILVARYGLLDGREATLAELGHKWDITSQSISRVQHQAEMMLLSKVQSFDRGALKEFDPVQAKVAHLDLRIDGAKLKVIVSALRLEMPFKRFTESAQEAAKDERLAAALIDLNIYRYLKELHLKIPQFAMAGEHWLASRPSWVDGPRSIEELIRDKFRLTPAARQIAALRLMRARLDKSVFTDGHMLDPEAFSRWQSNFIRICIDTAVKIERAEAQQAEEQRKLREEQAASLRRQKKAQETQEFRYIYRQE
jgi:superfamily II DNA or RNA helicase